MTRILLYAENFRVVVIIAGGLLSCSLLLRGVRRTVAQFSK